jgi:PTS system nitrogen regulatory IIA component
MTLSELVGAGSILVGATPPNRKAAFQALAQQMAPDVGLPVETLVAALTEREKLGTTGFGGGVAIPHGRPDGISGLHGGIAVLASPIDYDAVDGRPVDILFALLAPEEAGADHLKALARVSRAFRIPGFAARLRGARDADAVRALLAEEAERAAA